MQETGVHLKGVLLKPNMILPGNSCSDRGSREKVAKMTVDCLTENVPAEVPGIVFLSGGQSDEDATAHLNLMNAMNIEHPWELSYSYGRALLAHALQTWARGSNEGSQNAFRHRAGNEQSGENRGLERGIRELVIFKHTLVLVAKRISHIVQREHLLSSSLKPSLCPCLLRVRFRVVEE